MTPHEVAVALLAGPLDASRFRKTKRHLRQETDVRAFFDALQAMTDAETCKRVREGLQREGVTP